MSMIVTVTNEANLKKVKDFLGAKDENEAIDIAIERIVREFEQKEEVEDSPEDIDIDVHTLNRIPPKKTFTVKANFRFKGRGKPMKYDLSDYNFDEYDTEE